MDLRTLQRLRIVIPGVMILLVLMPLREQAFDLNSLVENLRGIDVLARGVIAIICGAAYYFSELRTYFLATAYKQIRDNIKARLLAPCLNDPEIALAADRLREGRALLDSVFYNLVDTDRSLTEKAKRVYFNGLIWSSAADLDAVSTFGALIYWAAVILYEPRPHFVWAAGALGVIQVIASLWLVPRLTNKHIALQNEQLDYITTSLREQLCARLRELASIADEDAQLAHQ